MKRVLVVHGMKRSGNHAIINWLIAHDRFIFLNNVIPIGPILSGREKIPPPEEFTLWLQRKLLPKNLQFAFFLKKVALRKHSLIVSLEDHDLQVRPFLKVPCDVSNILIMRDPCNLLSSRIRKASNHHHPAYPKDTGPAMNRVLKLWKSHVREYLGREASNHNHLIYPKDTGPAMNRVLKLWKSHAREYLGLTNHLENKVCIYFNSWFSNLDYRQRISRKLNFEFTDSGFSQVSHEGGGSSFDNTNFDGNNRMMDVLNRQDYLTDPERYLLENILADDEFQEFDRRIRDMNQVETGPW